MPEIFYMWHLFMLKARTVAYKFYNAVYFHCKEYSLKALSFCFQKILLT